jgi:hypothetical protein
MDEWHAILTLMQFIHNTEGRGFGLVVPEGNGIKFPMLPEGNGIKLTWLDLTCQSGGLVRRRSRFESRQGRPLYIWMYDPALWICSGGDIALYKTPHFFILLNGRDCREGHAPVRKKQAQVHRPCLRSQTGPKALKNMNNWNWVHQIYNGKSGLLSSIFRTSGLTHLLVNLKKSSDTMCSGYLMCPQKAPPRHDIRTLTLSRQNKLQQRLFERQKT